MLRKSTKGIAEMVSFPEWETTCYQEEQLELWNYYYIIMELLLELNYGIILLLLIIIIMELLLGCIMEDSVPSGNQPAKAHSKTNMCVAEAGRVRWVAFPGSQCARQCVLSHSHLVRTSEIFSPFYR